MNTNRHFSRLMSLVLSAALMMSGTPITAFAEAAGCNHIWHDESCGYVEGAECGHKHDESCGEGGAECTHIEHDEDCGYIEAAPCRHVCDKCCGGLVDSGKTLGDSGDDEDDDPATHTETVIVAAFDKLEDEILRQDFDLGEIQSEDEITLPDALTGTDADDNAVTIDGVTWRSAPEFDPEAAGTYRFSPKLPEEYELAADVTPPAITVTLGTRTQENPIIITAFDDLDDDISGQSYDLGTVTSIDDLILPDTLTGSSEDGGEITIGGVTWECEAGFDPAVAGGYLFSAVLPEGYILAEGLSAPFIFVFIRPEGEPEKSTYTNGSVTIESTDDAASLANKFTQAFNGAGSGDTITVTGSKTDVGFGLELTIPAGVMVDWQATYIAPAAFDANLITLSSSGAGTLKVTDGKISAATYITIGVYGTNAVEVTGGEVSTATGMAIYINGSGSVSVSGGEVTATGDGGRAIYAGNGSSVTVSGDAAVSAANGRAINASGGTVEIEISGTATVTASGTDSDAIYAGYNTVVIVKDSAKITGTNSYGIHLAGANTTAVLQGGEVVGSGYAVINYGTVYYIGSTTVADNKIFVVNSAKAYYLGSVNASKFTNGTANQLDAALDVVGSVATLPDVLNYNTITVNNASTAGAVADTAAGTVTFTTPGTYSGVTLGVTSTVPGTDIPVNFTTPTFSVSVTKSGGQVTIGGLSIAGKTYDGAPHGGYTGNAAYTTNPGGQSVSPTGSLAATYTGLGTTTYGPTNAPPTNVGSYKVTVTLVDDTYYGTWEEPFDINPKPINITGVIAVNREYNGTTAVTLTGSGTLGGVLSADMGKVGFDLSGGGTITNKNAGYQSVTTNITLNGSASGNYTLNQPTGLIVSITQKPLTDITFTPANKDYDGTTTATVPDANVVITSGVVGSDTVTVQISAASFSDKNVGNSKTVTINAWQLTGSDAGNYSLPASKPTATANITAKALTIGGFTISKVYDGSNTVTGGFGTLVFTGLQNGETASVNTSSVTATYDNKNVGTGKAITFGGSFGMSGGTASASNYTITQPTGVTGTITQKSINGATVTINDTFTYNGNAQTLTLTDVSVVLGGTALTASDYTYGIAGEAINAGNYTVNVNGIGNYTGTATGSFTIAKAPAPTISWPTSTAITYGATLSTSALTGGDTTYGSFAWTNGAIYPTVNNSGYSVTFTPSASTIQNYGPITPATQTVSITVSKATATGADQTYEVVKNHAQDYSFDLTKLLPNVSPLTLGTVTYEITAVTDANSVWTTAPSTGVVTSPLTLPVSSVGTVGATETITVKVSSDNYNDFTATITIEVIDKIPVTISTTMNGGTYNGSPFAYTGATVTQNTDDEPVTGLTLDALYESTDGGGYSSATAPTNAGAYKLTLSVPSGNVTYSGSATFNFTITQKQVTVRADDKSIKQGDALPSPTVSYTGFVGTDSKDNALTTPAAAQLNVSDSNTPGPSVIDFATNAVLNGGIGANYTLNHVNGTLTIIQKSASCDVLSVTSPSGATISGTTITASVANSVSSQLVSLTVSQYATWALYSDAACANEIPNKTMTLSEGANTAYIKVTAEDGNATKTYTVTVTRAAAPRTITASAGTGGTITPSGAVSVPMGGSQIFTIAPNNSYSISDVLVDGVSVGKVTSYTFSNVTSNHTISATFSYSGGGGSSSGSGGSSGGSTTTTTTTTTPTTTWLEQNPAGTLVNSAKGQNQGYVRTKSTGVYGVRKAAFAALAGLKYEHDTVADGAVQVRLYINDPANIKNDLMVSGYVKGSDVDYARNTFEKWFNNKVRAIHMDQTAPWGQPVQIAARIDLTGMDSKKLYFYAYDKKANTYRRIEKPAYWIDKNGYLHFETELAGDIIISEGTLERK